MNFESFECKATQTLINLLKHNIVAVEKKLKISFWKLEIDAIVINVLANMVSRYSKSQNNNDTKKDFKNDFQSS